MIPQDIPTYTTAKQGALLQKLAANKTCLEVGAFYGFSTVCMAQHARMVYSIDNHRGDIHLGRKDTFQGYLRHLQKYKVLSKVAILIGESTDILPRLEKDFFSFAFIDATHTYEAVKKDLELVLPLMHWPGLIAFHDYEETAEHTFGVTQAVNEAIAEGKLSPWEREGTLLACTFQS